MFTDLFEDMNPRVCYTIVRNLPVHIERTQLADLYRLEKGAVGLNFKISNQR